MKRIVSAPNFRDYSRRAGKGTIYEDELNEIIEQISSGKGISEEFYRAGIDVDDDELLEKEGIMHLHLGGKNSDVLLFLVQYPDRVVLLEINTHKHFRTEPVGSILKSLHDHYLARAAAEARVKAQELAEQADATREGRLAAAKAKLKARASARREAKDKS